MNEEIKEILELKYDIVDEFGNDYKKIKFKDCKLLLDYITNLQEEVNQLTAESTEWESKCYDLQEELEEEKRIEQKNLETIQNLEEENEKIHKELDYSDNYNIYLISKIDKAIEYHNNCIENLELSKIDDNKKLAYQVAYEIHKNYLNILQGDDKE